MADICHHSVFLHGRPSRGEWDNCAVLSGSDFDYVEEGRAAAGYKLLCGKHTLSETKELSIAERLDNEGMSLLRRELKIHNLEFEMSLVDTVVPRLRRNPRLREASSAIPWLTSTPCPPSEFDVHFQVGYHKKKLGLLRKLKERPITDAELLACLLCTGTDAQGLIRRALRSPSSTGDAKGWKWTCHALRHAAIKLAEPPPSVLYHGLNNVQPPDPDSLYYPTEYDSDDMDPPVELPPSGSYSNFISGSMSIDMARKFAVGGGGTVANPSSSGCVLHISLGEGAGKLSWRSEGLIVADMRWISKFPDEQEWLIVPTAPNLALYFQQDPVTERTPFGGEIIHLKCEWWRVGDDPSIVDEHWQPYRDPWGPDDNMPCSLL